MKWLIVFDLDGTLAESKRPLSAEMAETLARLLTVVDIGSHQKKPALKHIQLL